MTVIDHNKKGAMVEPRQAKVKLVKKGGFTVGTTRHRVTEAELTEALKENSAKGLADYATNRPA